MELGRIPNRLKQCRRIAGFSQKKVARLLRMRDTSMLSRWEHGISVPSIIKVFGLSRLYNVLPHELYGEMWQRATPDPDLLIPQESITSQETFLL